MNPRMIFSLGIASMSLVFAIGRSSEGKKKSSQPKRPEIKPEMAQSSDHASKALVIINTK